jgi:kynurenine formamidase
VWVAKNGPIPEKACVAMNAGWDADVTSPKFRNADDKKVLHFPGFHPETAKMLLETTTASGLAVDTLSLGPSPNFATHTAWLPSGRGDLRGQLISAVFRRRERCSWCAPKIRGATGGPCRVFAFV